MILKQTIVNDKYFVSSIKVDQEMAFFDAMLGIPSDTLPYETVVFNCDKEGYVVNPSVEVKRLNRATEAETLTDHEELVATLS